MYLRVKALLVLESMAANGSLPMGRRSSASVSKKSSRLMPYLNTRRFRVRVRVSGGGGVINSGVKVKEMQKREYERKQGKRDLR